LSKLGGDRFGAERFPDPATLIPRVDVYPDEAAAYCAWFGKTSVSAICIECAKEHLSADRRKIICPNGLLLWDLSPPSSGWYNAVGFNSDFNKAIEIEFCDCDRDTRVGFATKVVAKFPFRNKDKP
jgi:hypothetical protein